jgi:minichromosome maintenance protein 10
MILRESPKKAMNNPNQQWPPRSPHEALLSSPSGRRKFQQRRERDSVSPSPVKRRPVSRALFDEAEDEEEDEETLQLKLAQIEARLKLKKLQKEREARERGTQDGDNTSMRERSRPGTRTELRAVDLPRPRSAVEVPASPTRAHREPEEQKSPARVLLGIDKGLRAQDVSLKRAVSFHSRSNTTSSSLSRSNTITAAEAPRGKSFSERIAESRNKEKEKDEKQTRIEKSRSTGFGLKNIDSVQNSASSRASSSLSSGTRDTQTSSKRDQLNKGRSLGNLRDTSTPRPASNLSSRSDLSRTQSAAPSSTPRFTSVSKTAAKYNEISERDNSTEAASFESFSGLHLKARTMEHRDITRILDGKTILTIPQLLKTVKAPDYDPPDMENDYVVFGIICSKSSPLTPKNGRAQQSVSNQQETDAGKSGKFMVLRMTDLKWELDLFLFDNGFAEFWKLSVGTLVAVLNPEIMPPRQRDSGKFSLKLTDSDDTVLEIGTARDLDFCHAKRKDGKDCGQWIDSRKTEYCDFHIELQVNKSKRGRMEVNTMTGTSFGKGPGGSGKFGMFSSGPAQGNSGDLRREGKYHDRMLHETMYIAPGAGAAARLMDNDEDQGFERGQSRAERHRKQLAEKEKERELAKKLGQIGNGAGSDYMRVKGDAAFDPKFPARGDAHLSQPTTSTKESTALDDLLGLQRKNADDVHLSPVKRKRITSGKSTASSEPMGWGGAYKRGLLLSPTKAKSNSSIRETRETSPAKKKARLLLPEKGIREPGRESLGNMDVGLIAAMDEDDDLEII